MLRVVAETEPALLRSVWVSAKFTKACIQSKPCQPLAKHSPNKPMSWNRVRRNAS